MMFLKEHDGFEISLLLVNSDTSDGRCSLYTPLTSSHITENPLNLQ
jgi:hypothetical protein